MSEALGGGEFHSRSPTALDYISAIQELGKKDMNYENKFIVLSHTTKAVRPSVASKVVKSKPRQEGGMSLAARDDALLPRRKNVHQVILAASLSKRLIRRGRPPLDSKDVQ